jgi:hypothetical protein
MQIFAYGVALLGTIALVVAYILTRKPNHG